MVLVVTGTGHCFSSGADFKATLQRDGSAAPHERSYAMYEPFLSLLDIAVPVIGALNGHTVGGGFGLALVCDLRVGAEDAKYGANFVRLGLAPGMAISYLLPRLVGVARANELLLAGRLVEGREATTLGILNRAVPAAQVMPVAMELANETNMRVVVTGGIVRPGEHSLVGAFAERPFAELNCDVLFLGVGGVDGDHGLTEFNLEDARIKRSAIGAARRTVVLADQSKFGRVCLATIAPLESADVLISDAPAVSPVAAAAREGQVDFVHVRSEEP